MEPKLIYSCPIEELVGRKVVDEEGKYGTIVEVFTASDYPIVVEFKFIGKGSYTKQRRTYTNKGYSQLVAYEYFIQFADTSTETDTKNPDLQQTNENQRLKQYKREAYVKAIQHIRASVSCTLEEAIELYTELKTK